MKHPLRRVGTAALNSLIYSGPPDLHPMWHLSTFFTANALTIADGGAWLYPTRPLLYLYSLRINGTLRLVTYGNPAAVLLDRDWTVRMLVVRNKTAEDFQETYLTEKMFGGIVPAYFNLFSIVYDRRFKVSLNGQQTIPLSFYRRFSKPMKPDLTSTGGDCLSDELCVYFYTDANFDGTDGYAFQLLTYTTAICVDDS